MKRRVKRRSSKKTNKSVMRSPLSGAINDLSIEVKKLSSEKSTMKNALMRVSSSLDSNRNMERALQKKIARLIDKEARLNKKRKVLGMKIDQISDHLNKVNKIRSEMADI